MGKYIILAALILGLATFSTCSAMTALNQSDSRARGAQAGSSESLTQQRVINIRVSSIEDGQIYSKNGRQFDISGAKVINDNQSGTRITGAELDYLNGELVQVILK